MVCHFNVFCWYPLATQWSIHLEISFFIFNSFWSIVLSLFHLPYIALIVNKNKIDTLQIVLKWFISQSCSRHDFWNGFFLSVFLLCPSTSNECLMIFMIHVSFVQSLVGNLSFNDLTESHFETIIRNHVRNHIIYATNITKRHFIIF